MSADWGESNMPLSAARNLAGFVLYAERAAHIGPHAKVHGGDIGVRSVADCSGGYQLVVGAYSEIEHCHELYAQSNELSRR